VIEARAHARLSPNAAARWMSCPGSVRMCESVVDSSSDYADRGTACHAVLERVLNGGGPATLFVGEKIAVGEDGRATEIEITAEMAGWVDEAASWVRNYLEEHPGSHLRTEERIIVGRAFGEPDDLWGTADVVIAGPDELVVADAKFGYVEVAAVDNPQLILYVIGGAAEYGWIHERYRIAVLQPQAGEPKVHALSRAELQDYVRRYAPKIAATHVPDAPLIPSDKACRWCEAAGVCPELQKRALVLAQREFASVETLPPEQLAALIQHADRIRAGLKAAELHALKLIQLGGRVLGFKIVAGDKHRVWKDEGKAVRQLRGLGYDKDDIAPRKLLTPAQAEKLVGRAAARLLAPIIEKPKGDATLAPEGDPRPSLAPDFGPVCDACRGSGQERIRGLNNDEVVIPCSVCQKILPGNAAAGKPTDLL